MSAEPFTLILTHKGCFDGYLAYVIARSARGNLPTIYHGFTPNDLERKLVAYFEKMQNIPIGEILSFDLSFSPEALAICKKITERVHIYDHHQTTLRRFGDNLPANVIFNNSKSGASLAWDFFYPNKPAPPLVRYIEARDLWQFDRIENSRPITDVLYATLEATGFEADSENLKNWCALLAKPNEEDFLPILNQAPCIELTKTNQINRALSKGKTHIWKFKGQTLRVFCINSDTHISDLGAAALALRSTEEDSDNMLLNDLALIWYWNDNDRQFHVSLRSYPDSPADASAIAESFGGGGHRNAAGFSSKTDDFLRGTHFPIASRFDALSGVVLFVAYLAFAFYTR